MTPVPSGWSISRPLAGLMCLAAGLLSGCTNAHIRRDVTFSYFHAQDFTWPGVARVVVLPLVNEASHPQAADEIRRSLTAELQQLGCFEIVPAPAEATLALSRRVREAGSFPEAEMVNLARCTRADVILTGTVGHYSPYFRPRIGLTLQAISPDLGRVVASVDGMWDANNLSVGDRARAFYARKKSVTQVVYDAALGTLDDSYGAELALESPHLYQRFVCSEAARLLVGDPAFLAIFYPPQHASPAFGARLRGLFHRGSADGACGTPGGPDAPAGSGTQPAGGAQKPAGPGEQKSNPPATQPTAGPAPAANATPKSEAPGKVATAPPAGSAP